MGLVQTCNPYCTTTLIDYTSENCQPAPIGGGIDKIVWAECDIADSITDLTSQAEWQAAITADQVKVAGFMLAEIPAPSPTSEDIASCLAPVAVRKTRTMNITDNNTYDGAALRDLTAFYNGINADLANGAFGYIDCNGYFYGWIYGAVSDINRIHELKNDTGKTNWQGTIVWETLTELTPVLWPTGLSY